MKQKTFYQTILYPTMVLFMICLICTALLVLTNQFTAPIIQEQLRKQANAIYTKVFDEADDFQEKSVDYQGETYKTMIAKHEEEVLGYVFEVSNNGYGGPIVSLIGVDKDGKIKGLEILSMTETANLGDNAKKPEWREQFVGKMNEVKVVKATAKADEIQALTGATITSEAISKSVNTALQLAKVVEEGSEQ